MRSALSILFLDSISAKRSDGERRSRRPSFPLHPTTDFPLPHSPSPFGKDLFQGKDLAQFLSLFSQFGIQHLGIASFANPISWESPVENCSIPRSQHRQRRGLKPLRARWVRDRYLASIARKTCVDHLLSEHFPPTRTSPNTVFSLHSPRARTVMEPESSRRVNQE